MAEITELKTLVDSYGVAVRAGTITPQTKDEEYFRELMGIPEMSDAVKADWEKSGGVRHPITLAAELADQDGGQSNA